MDPRKMQFTEQTRKLVDDDEQEGLNCRGCVFYRQSAAVCVTAAHEATKRGLRDCDAVDQFGEVVVYVRTDVDPRQQDLLGEATP